MTRDRPKALGSAGTGTTDKPRRLVLLLAVAVAVPSACVLWFMNQAVNNERLAVRQKLTEAYEPRLTDAAAAVADFWRRKAEALRSTASEAAAPERFAALVTSGVCASAGVYDEDGSTAYPVEPPADAEPAEVWAGARALEAGGDTAGAVKLLAGLFTDPKGADARDPAGG